MEGVAGDVEGFTVSQVAVAARVPLAVSLVTFKLAGAPRK